MSGSCCLLQFCPLGKSFPAANWRHRLTNVFLLCFNYKGPVLFFFFSDTQVCKHDLDSKNNVLHNKNCKFHLNLGVFHSCLGFIFFPQQRREQKSLLSVPATFSGVTGGHLSCSLARIVHFRGPHTESALNASQVLNWGHPFLFLSCFLLLQLFAVLLTYLSTPTPHGNFLNISLPPSLLSSNNSVERLTEKHVNLLPNQPHKHFFLT